MNITYRLIFLAAATSAMTLADQLWSPGHLILAIIGIGFLIADQLIAEAIQPGAAQGVRTDAREIVAVETTAPTVAESEHRESLPVEGTCTPSEPMRLPAQQARFAK